MVPSTCMHEERWYIFLAIFFPAKQNVSLLPDLNISREKRVVGTNDRFFNDWTEHMAIDHHIICQLLVNFGMGEFIEEELYRT